MVLTPTSLNKKDGNEKIFNITLIEIRDNLY